MDTPTIRPSQCGQSPRRAVRPDQHSVRPPLAATVAALALAFVMLFSGLAAAATLAVAGNPAPANEGTGPSITVTATNTQTSYNVVVYSDAIDFSAKLSNGKKGVPVTFTFSDASGNQQTTNPPSISNSLGIASASFTPAAPGVCTCQASASGYTPGSGNANSLQVEYFHNGQEIPNPLSSLPVQIEGTGDVTVQATPDAVPIELGSADQWLELIGNEHVTVQDISQNAPNGPLPRQTSAYAMVGPDPSTAVQLSGLPTLPITVENILVRAYLSPNDGYNGVPLVLNNLGDAQHNVPTDFSGYLWWSEPEYDAGLLANEISFSSVNWAETGANQATQAEADTPNGKWSTFPITGNGQNTGTIKCTSGSLIDSDSTNFNTSYAIASLTVSSGTTPQPVPGGQSQTYDGPVAPSTGGGTLTMSITFSGTVSFTTSGSTSLTTTNSTTSQNVFNVSGSVDDFVDASVSDTYSLTSTQKQVLQQSDSWAKDYQSGVSVTDSYTAPQPISPYEGIMATAVPVAPLDKETAEVYPDANHDGVASGPVETHIRLIPKAPLSYQCYFQTYIANPG